MPGPKNKRTRELQETLVEAGPKLKALVDELGEFKTHNDIVRAYGALLSDIANGGMYATPIRVVREVLNANRVAVTDRERYKEDSSAYVAGDPQGQPGQATGTNGFRPEGPFRVFEGG